MVYAHEPSTLNNFQYAQAHKISLVGMHVSDNIGAVPGVSHPIRVISPERSFILGTSSMSEKLSWMNRFQEVLDEFNKSASKGSSEALRLGDIAPVWVITPPDPLPFPLVTCPRACLCFAGVCFCLFVCLFWIDRCRMRVLACAWCARSSSTCCGGGTTVAPVARWFVAPAPRSRCH